MVSKDLRNEHRFSSSLLPGKYSTLSVKLSTGEEDIVRTTDVSVRGFGIITEKPINLYQPGKQLKLYPAATQRPIYGRIAFSKQIDNLTRVGIELMEFGHYSVFKNEIESILKRLSDDKKIRPQ